MTVAQLRSTMTIEEERGWLAYHTLVAEERKAAMESAKRGSKASPRRMGAR